MRASCSYLVLYMISCFFTAMPLGSVDALVPFMAHRAHTDQSEYSNIYTIIGFALLAGAIVQKALSMYKLLPNHHTIMVIGNLGIAVFSMIITLMDSRDTQYIAWSVLKIFNYFFMVSTNNSLINASSREEIGQWIAFSHGAQGFGTLFGSIITEYMGMNMFYIVAAGCVLITPFFLCMESPEKI
jgi:predicted MFS family arabinose efflux permease